MYIGVTSNLERRVHEHKEKLVSGFTQKYNVIKLVYFEHTSDILSALKREKEIKIKTKEPNTKWTNQIPNR